MLIAAQATTGGATVIVCVIPSRIPTIAAVINTDSEATILAAQLVIKLAAVLSMTVNA